MAQVVCDPTLLFDAEGWKQMLSEKKIVEEPYVFCYFWGQMKSIERLQMSSKARQV